MKVVDKILYECHLTCYLASFSPKLKPLDVGICGGKELRLIDNIGRTHGHHSILSNPNMFPY